jgi:hypothetical protein
MDVLKAPWKCIYGIVCEGSQTVLVGLPSAGGHHLPLRASDDISIRMLGSLNGKLGLNLAIA